MSNLVTAKDKLELSQLTPKALQRELLGTDVDVEKVRVVINRSVGLDLGSRLMSAEVERSMDSDVLTLQIDDSDRSILRSGSFKTDLLTQQKTKTSDQQRIVYLHNRLDMQIDGLWWRLNGFSKNGDELSLIFITREIAVLKNYASHIIASRSKVTRAQFILRMIREVKEFQIPVFIPELNIKQPIEKTSQTASAIDWANVGGKDYGIPKNQTLSVKRAKMNEEQRNNANIILETGVSQKVNRKVLVASIMCAIQESSITNLGQPKPGAYNYLSGDPKWNPVGVFQQIAGWGWPASRDVATDAAAFFRRAQDLYEQNPQIDLGTLVEDTQGNHDGTYDQHRTEAERIVTDYGQPSKSSAKANTQAGIVAEGGEYHYFRGIPPLQGEKKWQIEDSWDCIQRLANEVNFRAFFVSGVFYYISEDELLKYQPRIVFDENSDGVHSIDGEYMQGSKVAEVQVSCDIGRWTAPPGSIASIINTGPFNGRWIVSKAQRSLFETLGTVTLKKSDPVLPEPSQDQLNIESGYDWSGLIGADANERGDDVSLVESRKSTRAAASAIIDYHTQGMFRDDNGSQLSQLKKLARGEILRSQCGENVDINPSLINTILSLLQAGWKIGTFAICEDHRCYSSRSPLTKSQHSMGQAVDISSLAAPGVPGWYVIGDGQESTTRQAKELMALLQPVAWDLFCNGNRSFQSDVQALQMDNGKFVTGTIVGDHTDHIHFSVAPGGRD